MKSTIFSAIFMGLVTLNGCGSQTESTGPSSLQSVVNVIDNEGLLNQQLDAGKRCVNNLGFFERLYWNGFVDQWEVAVEDNFDVIPEEDRIESRLYEQVLKYQVGCAFAKKKVTEGEIRAWADQIKSQRDTPELILPEIKIVYEDARAKLNF